ncbi:hypothetical protein DSCA_29400 [Desulfosarcina alkanivorans]|jgi:hypothetical protein|uniref:DUF4177 domain-containing protein n=1 Tax=Desulfosarcina alkanivorans TaxID=571177 RepID=A0A5K7YLD4_9BACT|nr:hypothetical protein [Desulfosarcina alkanivorans]BBO69010.1 hypothetical protein DSCA_29400 [Desulfosarcina alkanivorans]
MAHTYRYETFRAPTDEFDRQFTAYLNERAEHEWHVKHCNYCHGSSNGKMYASCMFERSS